MSIFRERKHPFYINRFLFNLIEEFKPKPVNKEKCVFTSRDYVATVTRMCELEGTFLIRPYTYAGGETNYHLIQIFN